MNAGIGTKHPYKTRTIFYLSMYDLMWCFKGTVQRKLTGVESDINRKVFLSIGLLIFLF